MWANRRQLAIDYAMEFVGTWYSWGGDDPAGFDCSGFICEILQAVALLPRKSDFAAAGLQQQFAGKRSVPKRGALMFRGSPAQHVEMVIAVFGDDVLTIGASGGTSNTRSGEDAIRDNAFIKVRPWIGPFECLDPFYGVDE